MGLHGRIRIRRVHHSRAVLQRCTGPLVRAVQLRYSEFPSLFDREIARDSRYALTYGHLSTSPGSLLDEMILYTYQTADVPGAVPPLLGDVSSVKLRRLVFNLSKLGGPAMRLKWLAEKYLEPRLESCLISRNQALGIAEGCFVSRNEPMHDSVSYLKNGLMGETDILHEYYVPRDRFVPFVDGMREIMSRRRPTLLTRRCASSTASTTCSTTRPPTCSPSCSI